MVFLIQMRDKRNRWLQLCLIVSLGLLSHNSILTKELIQSCLNVPSEINVSKNSKEINITGEDALNLLQEPGKRMAKSIRASIFRVLRIVIEKHWLNHMDVTMEAKEKFHPLERFIRNFIYVSPDGLEIHTHWNFYDSRKNYEHVYALVAHLKLDNRGGFKFPMRLEHRTIRGRAAINNKLRNIMVLIRKEEMPEDLLVKMQKIFKRKFGTHWEGKISQYGFSNKYFLAEPALENPKNREAFLEQWEKSPRLRTIVRRNLLSRRGGLIDLDDDRFYVFPLVTTGYFNTVINRTDIIPPSIPSGYLKEFRRRNSVAVLELESKTGEPIGYFDSGLIWIEIGKVLNGHEIESILLQAIKISSFLDRKIKKVDRWWMPRSQNLSLSTAL